MQNSKDNLQKTFNEQSEQGQLKTPKQPNIHDIYDRIFKRIFSLSTLAIINLINSLFKTNHSLDSEVAYLNKEFVSKKLDKRFADVFLQINGITYHLEAQMQKDSGIVMRIFEYGFYHAMENWDDNNSLHFPEPIVIYLESVSNIPETNTLLLNFGEQGTFTYKVKNFVYQNHEIRELNQKKLIVFIPFQLLKLRKIIAEKPTKENFRILQNLILNDILGSIKSNLTVGNITQRDADELKDLTLQLYDHIYQHYEELGGTSDMRKLLEGAMVLKNDELWDRIEDLEEENLQLKKQKDSEIEKISKEKDSEIAFLKRRIAELEK